MRSGYTYLDSGTLWYAGIYAYDWSRMARLEVNSAYFLDVNSRDINSSRYYDRYVAFPVLSYVRSGYIDPRYHTLPYGGLRSIYWSGLARSIIWDAYFLDINSSTVDASYANMRYLAFPVQSYVRSGWINLIHKILGDAGQNGYNWSPVAHVSVATHARSMGFTNISVGLSGYSLTHNAFPDDPMCGAGILTQTMLV